MNAVIGMTGLALGTELTSEQQEYLGMVQISADSLLGLINDILDFSKIEAGELLIERAPMSIRECVENARRGARVAAASKNLELSAVVDPAVPVAIYGDSDPSPSRPSSTSSATRSSSPSAARSGAGRPPDRTVHRSLPRRWTRHPLPRSETMEAPPTGRTADDSRDPPRTFPRAPRPRAALRDAEPVGRRVGQAARVDGLPGAGDDERRGFAWALGKLDTQRDARRARRARRRARRGDRRCR